MSSHSKKFSIPDDASNFLFLTWETGFNQLKVYTNGRLITTLVEPSELSKGFYFDDEELGTIKIKLTKAKPAQIETSVNGTKYYPENHKANEAGLSGVASVFWILCVFAVVGSIIVQASNDFDLQRPLMMVELVLDFIIVVIYGASAYFIGKGKAWAYFLGTTSFLIMTILTAIGYNMMGWGGILIFSMIVRVAFHVFIFSYLKNALIALKAPSTDLDENLLDA